MSLSDLKRGFPLKSSPKTQPNPHRSTVFVYEVPPYKISGGRYQRVTAPLV